MSLEQEFYVTNIRSDRSGCGLGLHNIPGEINSIFFNLLRRRDNLIKKAVQRNKDPQPQI